MINHSNISIILPCHNEAENLSDFLPILCSTFSNAEIIVVDDASTDSSYEIANNFPVKIVRHPRNLGNGASIKTGARAASNEYLVFMDSDGQHNPKDIPLLLEKLEQGFDMVVGARTSKSHSSLFRLAANTFYNKLASFMTGFTIEDLTSGFRAVSTHKFRQFLYLLPNGFSYPTTSTMAFFRSGYPVAYIPINASTRKGKSKIRLLKDGARFFIIILKVGALFSPMRFFLPISLAFFTLASTYYIYTYSTTGRFTNMSALLYITSIITFMIGIVSEQISSLHYRFSENNARNNDD